MTLIHTWTYKRLSTIEVLLQFSEPPEKNQCVAFTSLTHWEPPSIHATVAPTQSFQRERTWGKTLEKKKESILLAFDPRKREASTLHEQKEALRDRRSPLHLHSNIKNLQAATSDRLTFLLTNLCAFTWTFNQWVLKAQTLLSSNRSALSLSQMKQNTATLCGGCREHSHLNGHGRGGAERENVGHKTSHIYTTFH